MVAPVNLKLTWIHNAIQFGYIAFFSISFPIAALIGLLINVFHINFFYFSLTDHTKRKPSLERGNIGVWNSIFSFMSFSALVVNVAILTFSSQGARKLAEIGNGKEMTLSHYIIVLVIAEHFIFLIKFVLTLAIGDKPKWIVDYIKERKFKKKLDWERAKRKILGQAKNLDTGKLKEKLFQRIKAVDINEGDVEEQERKSTVVNKT